MTKRLYVLWALLQAMVIAIAACQPTPVNTAPTVIPFPTATTGRTVHGSLGTVEAPPAIGQVNPATALAIANQPTPTPNRAVCPPPADADLGAAPSDGRAAMDTIAGYLNAGGTPAKLEASLRDTWHMLGDGSVRGDVDLTGEGVPEIIVAYVAPEGVGNLLIFSCIASHYIGLYQSVSPGASAPEILWTNDLNHNPPNDLLFANKQCTDAKNCTYETQLITWDGSLGRFVNLLDQPISSEKPPTLQDTDNDGVTELVVRLENSGNSRTGPLRTGINIYDWNGTQYTLSIVQLDPPRYRIQVVQEADRALNRLDAKAAIPLYQLALGNPDLRPWTNDEDTILHTYIQYRLLLAYFDAEDSHSLDLYQSVVQAFPDPANRPIYASLVDSFWNAMQNGGNLHSACQQIQDIIRTQPDAVDLMNRYGSRSPTYTAQDICPF